MALKFRQLSPFGVQLDKDLAEPFSPQDAESFRALFFNHSLILVRDQPISHALQSRLGAIIAPPVTQEGDSEILSNQDEKDIFGSAAIDYHADNLFSAHPQVLVSLHARQVVEGDSSTRFVSGVQAAAALPDDLRRRLAGRSVLLAASTDFTRRNRLAEHPVIPGAPWPQYVRPVIERHPITGLELLTPNHNQADCIVGLPEAQSEGLLAEIFALLYRPEAIFEHVWRNGDTIFWDNMALQHARPAIPVQSPRILQRVICGGKSFGEMFPIVYDSYTGKTDLAALAADR